MKILVAGLFIASSALAQSREPIIDMHLHARNADYMGPNPPPMCAPFREMPRWDLPKPIEEGLTVNTIPPCANPIFAAKTDEEVMRSTIEVMKRRNIIGMVSGEPELMSRWKAAGGERIIAGLDLRLGVDSGHSHVARRTAESVRALHDQGAFAVLGEVMAQYEGIPPNDERLEPYWALAEELSIPVGIHMGAGGPGDPYFGNPGYRARNSNPLLLEDVLVRHPKLRIYIMHAGYPMLEPLRALLFAHPQVYVDIASIVYTEPRSVFYNYLRGIVEAGYGDRVMFGSDQMIWPGVIEPSIRAIEEAPFLSKAQKRDILYNNAARFLRLGPDVIASHHRM
ncbi:MAG TPA: amidohydrolase family protein [Gemmatimonadaceae bacterium]